MPQRNYVLPFWVELCHQLQKISCGAPELSHMYQIPEIDPVTGKPTGKMKDYIPLFACAISWPDQPMRHVEIDEAFIRREIRRRWVQFPFTHWLRRNTAS